MEPSEETAAARLNAVISTHSTAVCLIWIDKHDIANTKQDNQLTSQVELIAVQ